MLGTPTRPFSLQQDLRGGDACLGLSRLSEVFVGEGGESIFQEGTLGPRQEAHGIPSMIIAWMVPGGCPGQRTKQCPCLGTSMAHSQTHHHNSLGANQGFVLKRSLLLRGSAAPSSTVSYTGEQDCSGQ